MIRKPSCRVISNLSRFLYDVDSAIRILHSATRAWRTIFIYRSVYKAPTVFVKVRIDCCECFKHRESTLVPSTKWSSVGEESLARLVMTGKHIDRHDVRLQHRTSPAHPMWIFLPLMEKVSRDAGNAGNIFQNWGE